MRNNSPHPRLASKLALFFLIHIAASLRFPSKLFQSDFQPLINRQGATGVQLAPTGSLAKYGLDPICEQVLYQSIQCNQYVASFAFRGYRSSLQDSALTDAVCVLTCENSMKTVRSRIEGACSKTPELYPGYPVLAFVDQLYAGWNETCLRDPTTGSYCNDIIESWEPIEDMEDMPEEQVCSFCYGAKRRIMQQSPYSVYDETFASQLGYVNAKCGQQSPTAPPSGGLELNVTVPIACNQSKIYNTKDGDSCDSIALAQSVSSASLFYVNSNIRDCGQNLQPGLNLCLPEACETVYSVQPSDTCVAVAVNYGTNWGDLVKWNAALDARCSNFVAASPSWGRTICVTPPGGAFDGNNGNSSIPGNGGSGGQGGSGDGYADNVVEPPLGPIGEGTTLRCGKWFQAEGEGCGRILARNAVPMDLFIQVNPSLKSAADCSANLITGHWYCLNPYRYWNQTSVG